MGWFGVDWRKSDAHLLLLSRFRCPGGTDLGDRWQDALKESPAKAVKRFLDEGMLVRSDKASVLTNALRVNDLKEMLKNRGLPSTGRKEDMVQQLMQADPKGTDDTVAKLPLTFVWSPRGKEIAEEYLATQKAERNAVEQQTMEFLKERKFKEACAVVASYEARQVFPRGIGVDWKRYDDKSDIAVLTTIFNRTPKILRKYLDETQMGVLRSAAGMAQLWGTPTEPYLPPDFKTMLPMETDAAARMFLFLGLSRKELAGYKKSGVVKKIDVLPAKDERVCAACASLSGKQFDLQSAPELPYEHCTSKSGCRCCYAPIV